LGPFRGPRRGKEPPVGRVLGKKDNSTGIGENSSLGSRKRKKIYVGLAERKIGNRSLYLKYRRTNKGNAALKGRGKNVTKKGVFKEGNNGDIQR